LTHTHPCNVNKLKPYQFFKVFQGWESRVQRGGGREFGKEYKTKKSKQKKKETREKKKKEKKKIQ